ncbi:MAG: glycosyltransferase [Methylovulum sp.]|nr:glycosyltransferase [Methylovulum sp.]
MQNKFSAVRNLSKNTFLGKKKKSSIEGYIERIDDAEIHGWVISREQEPLQLSLNIAGVSYPVSTLWHERADVAESFGDEFMQSGFTIKIPKSAIDAFLLAFQKGNPIDVLANNIPLVNRSKPYNPATGLFKSVNTKKLKTKKVIEGNVEQVYSLEVGGWVINRDKEDIALEISIDGVVYPVTPTWHERPDVAVNFGNEFVRSGFTVAIPNELVDKFLLACQHDNEALEDDSDDDVAAADTKVVKKNPVTIDIIANNIPLKSKIRQTNATVDFLPTNFKFATIAEINAKLGIYITSKDFHNVLTGQIAYPLRISQDNSINANFYLELAKQKLISHNIWNARTLLKICLAFEKRAEFLELLGNTYFEQRDYESAAAHYEAAIANKGGISKWLFSNLEHCKSQSQNPRAMVETLINGIERNPESNFLYDRLDNLVQDYWLKQQGILEALSIVNNRDALIAKMVEVSGFIYNTYLRSFGAAEHPQWLGSCNLKRILIVGDMHIPQCVRYRIDQKVEQLELADKEVTTISWTDLANEQNTLVFHDVVIFYRVPAEPQVLKAMAQVNATGKLSLYEIDDLLFEASYPPPLETYGGYLELNHYIQILKGMASFNAATRYCRFGIASTQPLADKLQALVFGQRCFVHRNGIDSSNIFKQKPSGQTNKTTIDIFYGSGTMAHNSDFNDLALPAIMRILDGYANAGLMIAGYLKLPAEFLKRYEGRVKQMPPVKNIKTYWTLLERADINLAVLHDDEINGCKSELKWFEAACLGIPSVMSSTANYRDVIHQGEDGLMAVTTEDWYQHLKALVDNPELRREMAEHASARVQMEYSVEALSRNICDTLELALSCAQVAEYKNRKKIALVNVYFPPQSIGGATRVVSDNFDVLQQNYRDQFELCVFTSDAEHKQPHLMTVYNHGGARVYRSTIVWREHMDWHASDDGMKELFSDFLLAEQPDLIHFHCVQRLGGSVLEAALEAEVPYIVTTHDAWWISDYQFLVDADNKVYPEAHPDPYEPYTPPSFTSLSDSIERILYLKDLLHSACAVLTVSESFADIYRKNEIPQIRVNKNGISESIAWQAKDTVYTDKVVCGHVGGMAEHKGYFLLKKAITKLQPKNIEMLIVDHSHEEGYRQESHWGKVPVTFIGRLSQTRVVELYRQIDVLFAPSTWPESYGLVTREAAACGCWVVASTMGGIGEDVIEGESGFVIEPTLDALTSCLIKIDKTPAVFKGQAHTPTLRRVAEQVKELADIYQHRTAKND